MDAVIIAGGLPEPGEPLYPFTQGKSKSLLDICGKPMIQWVLDALDQARKIDRIVIVGMGQVEGLQSDKVFCCNPDQGSMLQNIRSGVMQVMADHPDAQHVAVVSADIPAILPEQVDWVVETALQTDDDLYYNVVRREVMEKRFPGSNRSYARLKDMEVCGGDLNVIRTRTVTGNDELWERIIAARKNVVKQAALIGYDTLILLLLRQITLERAVKKVTRRIHLSGRALVCPYAEVAMDVDKPHQLELIRRDLCQRAQAG
jgi:GTP:adenosylcobinamide-phosphate guanylyltransferase